MKTGNLRDVKSRLSAYLDDAQEDYVLITKHGKPSALVFGVEGHDMEDVFYMTNPRFWKDIETRRKEKPLPWKKR